MFSRTLKQVYHADGIAEAVEIKLTPHVQGPEKAPPPHKDYFCVDESNCDPEMYYLCAHQAGGGVDYLECFDSQEGTAETKAKACASSTSLPWSSISSCFEGTSSPSGKDLLKQAAQYFDQKWPHDLAIPEVYLNGTILWDRSYDAIIKGLCATGIKAGVCSGLILV